jgi:bis(5'-nucleosyl)-tetraphosphatase (symmetrical)
LPVPVHFGTLAVPVTGDGTLPSAACSRIPCFSMSTYAIGDIQGCFTALQRLVEHCRFDPAQDKLWLVGDLVNRGPQSLEVLRYIKGLGDRAVVVLGNHDLHLLVVAAGYVAQHRGDTLDTILAATDRDELLDWLRKRPLTHCEHGWLMVHAGLLPSWTIARAQELAGEVETALRGNGCDGFLRAMYGNQPDRWDDALEGHDRLRVIVNAMTRMRVCTPDGQMEFTHNGERDDIPAGFVPWFEAPRRASAGKRILFGHWSAHGLLVDSDVVALDTGCLWGRALTALRLEDRTIFEVSCHGPRGRGYARQDVEW